IAITPRSRSASVSNASRLAAPRSLNAPVTWRLSSFSTTSAPVARDTASLGSAGVCNTRPAIRSAAACTSANRSTSDELDAEYLVGTIAAGSGDRNGVTDLLADKRLGQRRRQRQSANLDVGFMHADDLVGRFLLRLFIHQLDMRAEHHMLAGQSGRIDHPGRVYDFLQLGNEPFDEGLTFSRRMVLGVLGEIAMCARFGDLTNDRRALNRFELAKLVFEALQTRAGHRELMHEGVLRCSNARRRQTSGQTQAPRQAGAWPRRRFRTNGENRTGAGQLQAFPISARQWRAPPPGRRPSLCSGERHGSGRCGGSRSCRR